MSYSIDLIVPTVTGREESLIRCLDSFPLTNPIVVTDVPTCGEGWIEGLKHSRAPFVMLCCDDIEGTGDANQLNEAIKVASSGLLPAPVIRRPDGSIESAGGDMNVPGCLIGHVQESGTPVGFTPMPFGTREQMDAIGMIPAHYMTDVFFSYKARQLGIETVLCIGWELTHHHHLTGRKAPTAEDHRLFEEGLS